MITLALEFSSDQRSVAVVRHWPGRPARTEGLASADGPRDTPALGVIDQALGQAGVDRHEVERLVVGLGPGSYTGIRIAIAVGQAWQLARGVELLGLSSVEVMASQARRSGWWGKVHLVIDAQRNEFYHAVYEVSQAGIAVSTALRLAQRSEMDQLAGSGAILAGPDVTRLWPAARRLFPSAAELGELAVERTGGVLGETLEPIYLRVTDFVKAPAPRVVPDNK